MLITIGAELDGAHRMIDQIADRIERPTELLQMLSGKVSDYESEVFATRGHGTWAGADLVDTGALMAKLTGPANLDLGDDSVEAEETEYAGYLRAGARGTPKRDPAPLPPTYVQEQWAEDVLDSVLGGLL